MSTSVDCLQKAGWFGEMPEEHHKNLWGSQTFYRVLSLVNGGRALEDDLFAGLR